MAGKSEDVTLKIGSKADLAEANRAIKQMQSDLKQVAVVSAAAFAGFTAAIGGTVAAFSSFDNQMRSVKTLLDETSFGAKGLEAGFNDMRKDVLRLASDTPFAIETMNKALFDTVSAGIEASKAVEFLGVASKLAVAGVTDVSVATDGLTSALNAYQIESDKAETVASKFFTAQKFGKTTIEELSNGFGLVGASAQSFGVSLDELLGAVSAVTTAGVATNAAYTGMKAVLANVAKPTKDAAAEAERLGIQFDAASLRSKGLAGFLQEITQASGFTKDSITELFGSTEAQNIMFALTGAQAGKFRDIVKELGNEQKTAATFSAAYKEQNESLANAFARMQNQITVLAVQIGEHFAPAVSAAADQMERLMTWMRDNEVIAKTAAVILAVGAAVSGVVAGVAAFGLAFLQVKAGLVAAMAALKAIGVLIAGISLPITAAVAAVAALGYAAYQIYQNWDTFWPKAQGIFSSFVKGIMDLGGGLKDLLIGVFTLDGDRIQAGLEKAKQAFVNTANETIAIYDQDLTPGTAVAMDAERGVAAVAEAEDKKLAIIQESHAKQSEELTAFQERQKEAKDKLRELDFEGKLTDDELKQQLELEHQVKMGEIKSQQRESDLMADALAREKREEAERQERLKYAEDEKKHGKLVADLRAMFRSEEVQGASNFFGEMSQLTRSKNKELFQIGKAASIANAVVNVAEGVTRALASFPPPFSFVAAAAQAAAGAAQISAIGAQRLNKGGIVGGVGLNQDSKLTYLTPGEVVIPRGSVNESFEALVAKRMRDQATQSGESTVRLEVNVRDDRFRDLIEFTILEGRALGIGAV